MKRIIILMLSLIIACMSIHVVSYAADYSVDTNAVDFLNQLNIIDSTEIDPQQKISRAEFVDMLVKARNLPLADYEEGTFIDVTAETPYSSAIGVAKNYGLVSGGTDGKFEPDKNIVYSDAIKIVVSALGYSRFAAANGGYPNGYLQIAKDLGLLRGLSDGKKNMICKGEIISLIYSYLNADVCEIVGLQNYDLKQERVYGRNPLTQYFKLTKIEGVVETAGYSSLIYGAEIIKPEITIAGQTFTTSISNVQRFLGRSVIGWYNEDYEMNLIYVTSSNKSVVINAEDCVSFSNSILKVQGEGPSKKVNYKISKGFTFVKNGRSIIHNADDFLFKTGTIELVDNDNDGIYDIVIAKNGKYLVVSYVDTLNELIYDKSGKTEPFSYKNEAENYSQMKIREEDGTLTDLEIGNVGKDMVFTVFVSEDGLYGEAIASTKTVTGVINSFDDDTILVDDTEYKLNGYSAIGREVLGSNVTLLLAEDNTVTKVAVGTSTSMDYGYFLKFIIAENACEPEATITFLNTTGEVVRAKTTEKITLDGKRMFCNSDEVKNALMDGNVPRYQLIKYAQNDDGEVTKIDTAGTFSDTDNISDKYDAKIAGDDSLMKYFGPINSCYYGNGVFTPHAIYGAGTVLFRVPKGISVNDGKKYDDKYFTIGNKTDFTNYEKCIIDAYDMDASMTPAVIVYYTDDVGGDVPVPKMVAPCIVSEVREGLNAEDELGYYLYYWQNGKYYNYYMDLEFYNSLVKRDSVPKAGDIIRTKIDSFGEIIGLEIDVKYNPETKSPEITDNAPSGGQIDESYYQGKIFSANASGVTLLVEKASGYNSSYGDPVIDGLAPFVYSYKYIAVFDTVSKKVRPGKTEILREVISTGEEDASKAVVYCRTHSILGMFVYE